MVRYNESHAEACTFISSNRLSLHALLSRVLAWKFVCK